MRDEKGADIVYVATSGDTGGGAIYAAKVEKIQCITMGDTGYMAPDEVIASVLKKIDLLAYTVTKGICDGTIKGGTPVFFGIAEQYAGLLHNKSTELMLGADFLAKVDAVIAKVQSGEIKVPNMAVSY
jgi:basic membrane protein A